MKLKPLKNTQLDLFVKSYYECNCDRKHIFNEAEYHFYIKKLARISNIIIHTGWNLSSIYFYINDLIDSKCSAFQATNEPYLDMKRKFENEYAGAQINVKKIL